MRSPNRASKGLPSDKQEGRDLKWVRLDYSALYAGFVNFLCLISFQKGSPGRFWGPYKRSPRPPFLLDWSDLMIPLWSDFKVTAEEVSKDHVTIWSIWSGCYLLYFLTWMNWLWNCKNAINILGNSSHSAFVLLSFGGWRGVVWMNLIF